MIGARLRHDRGWSDACILNLSSRGLMVRAGRAPPSGSYVEICRGMHRIVARVVWTDHDRFGALTQDVVAVDAFANGDETPVSEVANLGSDRRVLPRVAPLAEQHDRSRRWSRLVEFVCVASFGCAAAFLAFDMVGETLSKPLSRVEARLGKG